MRNILMTSLCLCIVLLTLCSCMNSKNESQSSASLYEPCDNFSEGLIPVKKGSLYGYADTHCSLVIDCRFSRADSFHDGIAYAEYESGDKTKRVYIDTNGNEVFDYAKCERADYKTTYGFSEGLMAAKASDGSALYIDLDGKEVIFLSDEFSFSLDPCQDGSDPFDFHEGYAFVNFGDSLCCIDTSGTATPLDARAVGVIQPTTEGVALLLMEDSSEYYVGIYRPKENSLHSYQGLFFNDIPTADYYPDDDIIVCSSQDTTLLLDTNADLVANLSDKYDNCTIGSFSGSVAPIAYTKDGEQVYAYIGTKAEQVTEEQSKYCLGSYNGQYAIWRTPENIYVANRDFEIVSKPIPADTDEDTDYCFSEDYAVISVKGKNKLIDSKGVKASITLNQAYSKKYSSDIEPVRTVIKRTVNISAVNASDINKDAPIIGYWTAAHFYTSASSDKYSKGLHNITNDKSDDGRTAKAYLDFYDDGTAVFDIYISGLIDADGSASWTQQDDSSYNLIINGKVYRIDFVTDSTIDCYILNGGTDYISFEHDTPSDSGKNSDTDAYILPDVKSHVYTKNEILEAIVPWINSGYSIQEALRLARNECFANYGNVFKDLELNRYFYVEHADLFTSNSSLTADEIYNLFNSVEQKNIKTIKQLEEQYK